MNQSFESIDQSMTQCYPNNEMSLLRSSKNLINKRDSFKIFSDEKWEDNSIFMCSNNQTNFLSKFDSTTIQEKTSTQTE